jgi:xylan 1,4-beta-xylosidase
VTWAFEFEDQPYFDGFRDLATNGIDKPIVGIFRMLGQMSGRRVGVSSTGGLPLDDVRDRGVRDRADISALATRDVRSAAVLVWNYHDDNLPAPPAEVTLTINGLPNGRPTLTHYRWTMTTVMRMAWKRMAAGGACGGAAHRPERALTADDWRPRASPPEGQVIGIFSLPRQGLSS